ncbi:MAG: cytochrome c [Bacteroidota bacterium]
MIKSKNIITWVVALVFLYTVFACNNPDGNNPGSEYMPDMGHSIAYEANHYDYYSHNTWGSEDEYYKYAKPREPIAGTIARGYAGAKQPDYNGIPVNGSVPYYYADTEAERTRATNEIQENPYPITDAGLAVGKNLYNINCGICHGEKGNGLGWIYNDEENPNAKYPAAPANFLTDEFIAASPGRYYHSIMWGKNVMGHYKDKLSYEERWQVIHYIRTLQAKDKKLVYSETENTLNNYAIPGASAPEDAMAKFAKLEIPTLSHGHGGGHDNHSGGSHDSDGHEGGSHSSESHSSDDGHGHSDDGHSSDDHDH